MSTKLVKRDPLELYLNEVQRIPILTREEESSLAFRWFEKRDHEAAQRLVLSHLRLVVKVARSYRKYGLKLSDLIQEGNLGLMYAVDRFDPRKGYRLMTYAVWWIRAYIQQFVLRSWSMVRMGTTRAQRKIIGGLQKARMKIAALSTGKEPQALALAEELEVSEDELKETVHRMQLRDVSMDQPAFHDERGISFGETIADSTYDPEEKALKADLQEKVRETLDEVYEDLKPRERFLLERRLLTDAPMTLEAVGHEFGVTRERVRQIEERLKKKLRGLLAPALGLSKNPQSLPAAFVS